jgi:ERCC4-type nuclease
MVLVDDRSGSKDLTDMPALKDRCALTRLDSADVMLTGCGPGGSAITVGVELKSLSDLLSSISTGRLAATQIPAMLKSYDYSFLLYYGVHRPGPNNFLQVRRGKLWTNYRIGRQPVPYSYLEGFLLTAQMLAPLRVKQVYDFGDAAKWLAVLDHWLEKKWDRHRGLAVFDRSGETASPPGADPIEEQIARTASSLPGVEWVRGHSAAHHFESVIEMVNADIKEWTKIRGIGPVIARSAVTAIRRRKGRSYER